MYEKTEDRGIIMKQIIFFDGDCHVCQRSVQFILKYDQSERFFFASLQSKLAEKLLTNEARHANSVVLLKGEQEYLYTNAVIEISKQLSGFAKYGYLLNILPLPLRDKLYHFIAKRRYLFSGKETVCLLPSEQVKKRLLD